MLRPLLLALAACIVLPHNAVRAQSEGGAGGSAARPHMPQLLPEKSGTTVQLFAVSPVNERLVWVSGDKGTYLKTADGGHTWKLAVVPGAESLQFRDVQAFSDKVAYLLAAGTGIASKIYKTEDGGATWKVQFQNEDPNAFYDCFAFWNEQRGLTTSDSVNGRFPAVRTQNGGESWIDIGDHLPKAQPGEASFAASGTCVATEGWERGWIGTGGAKKARVLTTFDEGNTWTAYDTPIVQGTPTSGVISIDFRDGNHGILGGGELLTPTVFSNNIARSWDGGRTWRLAHHTPFPGAVYGLSYTRHCTDHLQDFAAGQTEGPAKPNCYADQDGQDGEDLRTVVATGPSGAGWTPDEGETWYLFPGVTNYWAVAFADPEAGWMVGSNGQILKISF